ncbi:MAG: ExbD/TolR family protein [Gammaproteobacteria bacterium]
MSRRSHHGRNKEAPELDITAFLNLMVVLVPFLLVSAVFSRITILELNIPTAAGASQPSKIKLSVEVIIREKGLEIGNGRKTIARFPKKDDEYDLAKLSEYLLKIKGTYPDKTDAMVLMEPDIEYDYLVLIMDAVRSAEVRVQGEEEVQKIALFPDISIGDAP